MKRWICLLLAALLLLTPAMALEQPTDEELKISAPSAILMERSTGTVLYEKNADEHLSPASVTKVMTLLLIMEQLDSGQLDTSDIVTASAQASSMGGSQIWLKEGEQSTRCSSASPSTPPMTAPSPWQSTSPVPRRRSPSA